MVALKVPLLTPAAQGAHCGLCRLLLMQLLWLIELLIEARLGKAYRLFKKGYEPIRPEFLRLTCHFFAIVQKACVVLISSHGQPVS